MIRLNIRKGESVFRFGSPMWLDINNKPMSTPDVLARLSGKRVCLLIHGYNVDEPMPALSLVARNVEDLYAEVVGGTWPGSKEAGFWWAEKRADTAGKILAELFAGLPHASLDVQGHSCGCRVALEAVKAGLKVRNLILAAAATDNETVHIDQKYGKSIQANVERCLVAHSRNDGVLRKAFRVSSWLKRLVSPKNWGDDCCALGYTGPQDPARCPPCVSAVNLSKTILKHGDYKYQEDYFAAWRALASK